MSKEVKITETKASDHTRAHLNAPGNIKPNFKDADDMAAKADKILSAHESDLVEEANRDKEKGLDINDPKSIISFEPNYTPRGTKVLVKEIREDLKIGSILIPDNALARDQKKFLVIVAGTYVNDIAKGDIVFTAPTETGRMLYSTRIFKGIKFMEIDSNDIGGIMQPRKVVMERINA